VLTKTMSMNCAGKLRVNKVKGVCCKALMHCTNLLHRTWSDLLSVVITQVRYNWLTFGTRAS